MIQEKLNSLRPYVTGIRFVKDLPVVDLVIKEGWNMFETDNVSYKPSSNNKNYFMVFPKNPKDNIDIVVTHVENVISVNIENENKLTLLKVKIEELKRLFGEKKLKQLEKLKFVFDEITTPTLEDINLNPKNRNVKNGIELPPKEENKLELEEEGK
tara:strand:- start:6337 stop:6804 length:468 start_codon:yes stop_codon:yes gene_type:complete